MHYVTAQPGMLDAERELVLIRQSRGDLVFLSAADTDLSCAAGQWPVLFGGRLRLAHAGPLRQPVAVDDYVEKVLIHAKLVVAKLLGGRAYFPYLITALEELRGNTDGPKLLLLGGTGQLDEDLAGLNDFPLEVSRALFAYFREGGIENFRLAGRALEQLLIGEDLVLSPVVSMPDHGWHRDVPSTNNPMAWVLYYRAWHQSGDMAVIDSLIDALSARGFDAVGFYAHSLRDEPAQRALIEKAGMNPPDIILTMQSFALGGGGERTSFLDQFDCPILQVPVSSMPRVRWSEGGLGLPPAETAMNIVLPEIDGRIFATVAGFKEEAQFAAEAEWTVKRLVPEPGQIDYISALAKNWADLRREKISGKRVAIILSNYPNRNGRIGNGVGLDTPASAVELLHALKSAGYEIDPLPCDGEELMAWLQADPTNDEEQSHGKSARQFFSRKLTNDFIAHLPAKRAKEIFFHWEERLKGSSGDYGIAGIQLGNVFIGIQPPRGFAQQTSAIYHSPDLPPTPEYLAFYLWLREEFSVDAIIHLGKHGNLEWLPGRSVALGPDDYPALILGPTPHLYPFIVNNPGEGAQAKRRTSAVIVDHLTPPLTRAGLYADLEKMERLMEEYAHAESLYPARAMELRGDIETLLAQVSWREELPAGENILSVLGQYLCEIKESQIRSGLHILGRKPVGEKEIDFLLSLMRCPFGDRPGLMEVLHGGSVDNLSVAERDSLEMRTREWIQTSLEDGNLKEASPQLAELQKMLCGELRPRLDRCSDEIDYLLYGLAGRRVPPGPAGAPTRGRIDVLPTGRNFFAVDPRIVPTPSAWRCGRRIADLLLERHRQEKGEYPRTVALVIWGTSNMRTGGDDIGQALWLWGCEPVWDESSGRVIDFRIIPAHLLGRPRVDVTLRVSGLFRDAFGETLRLLAAVPKRLAQLDEPAELNPLRSAFLRDEASLREQGMSVVEATRRAGLRVFSSGPGCYGTGLLPLIDAGNWETKQDITEVFCRWGSHAYDHEGATDAPDLLRQRLREIEVVHQNQDNREHDILDSDDYFQFQGGLQAAVQAVRGSAPANYHGDSSRPDRPRVRALSEELVRVLRSRVLNPRWLAAMRKHGYKGAFEMAATVDYLFGYSATTGMITDNQFADVAQDVLLDPIQREFFERHNPAALVEAAGRMLEAHERGLWGDASPKLTGALEELVLELKGNME